MDQVRVMSLVDSLKAELKDIDRRYPLLFEKYCPSSKNEEFVEVVAGDLRMLVSKDYGGYISIDLEAGRNPKFRYPADLFIWFVEKRKKIPLRLPDRSLEEWGRQLTSHFDSLNESVSTENVRSTHLELEEMYVTARGRFIKAANETPELLNVDEESEE